MRKRKAGYVAGVLLVLAVAAQSAAVGSLPPLSPSAKDKCPVCGMFVAKYPDWLAQVRFKDQKTVFFDGAKDLFKYYFKMNRYHSGRSPSDVAAIYVTDYYTVRFIEAAVAFFVTGSDVYGPMGRELIPFETAATAAEFLRDHRGRRILRFAAVTQELLRTQD